MRTWTVATRARLDQALTDLVGEGLTRARAQKLIERRAVSVNGTLLTRPAHIVRPDDVITVEDVPLQSQTVISPVDLALDVLYEDGDCFVLNKPIGFAVHPGAGMAPDAVTILSGVAWLYQERRLPFSSGHCLVHRLDKDTSGCLLVAKTPEAHAALQKQFADRTTEKTYLALVAGVPKTAAAIIDAPLGRNTLSRTRMTVIGASRPREAKTSYRTIAASTHASLLECRLFTGRTHQARVHLRSIGHPILGDDTYATDTSKRLTHTYAVSRPCLHAWKLGFMPLHGPVPVVVTAPPPADFLAAVQAAGIDPPSLST